MNQLGDAIEPGKYILNGTLMVGVESRDNKTCIFMETSQGIQITTSIKDGTKWKVWYLLGKKESSGTLEMAPKE